MKEIFHSNFARDDFINSKNSNKETMKNDCRVTSIPTIADSFGASIVHIKKLHPEGPINNQNFERERRSRKNPTKIEPSNMN